MPDVDHVRSADRLFERVREQLAQGRYRPGQRINIAGGASEFGTSATPMREALSYMVGRDIMHERRGEGFYLNLLTANDIAVLYQLHRRCINLILRSPMRLAPPLQPIAAGGIWSIFAHLASLCANRVLFDLQRYLDDRLTLTRHVERSQIIGIDEMIADLCCAIDHVDRVSMRRISNQFHRQCFDKVNEFMQIITR
ncbi:GntR family transcriptional regulator [Sphingomonas abietis]|uniref:GntR family transcriptional regulator n=1 Tax=Sphingomonas abietis TaxID=3012344 RepID=A0ABY7NT34_9SPHN|nr:GntR family transcriptional regulator [Sphingomonas abietis]WBO24302.1 GntR family transcriptional regulator [Sphingomonas abietis]